MHVPVTIIAAVFLVIGVVLAKGGAGSFETVTVKKGDSISYLCFKIYNEYHEKIAAQIRRSNPGIADINIIYPGQKIKFPIFGPPLAERPTPAVIKGPPMPGKKCQR